MYETQNTIGAWVREAFNPDLSMQVKKLHEEVAEFSEAVESGNLSHAAEELADIAIVVFGLAFQLGVPILKGMNSKMITNRNRKWKFENGVNRHV